MISVEGVSIRFGHHVVLDRVSLEVPDGATTVILGPSGIGKTVLLKIMAGLLSPDRGRVFHNGIRIQFGRFADNRKLTGGLGYVFQGGALFDSMTVYENVAFPLREKTSLGEKQIREKVMGELELVGLRNADHKFPAELSGGMLKRVALARALVRDPEIVLFDEPTTGLDPVVSRAVLELFGTVHQRLKLTGVLVSHEIPRIFEIVQKVAMLHEGRIIALEPPERFCASPIPLIQEFVNGDTRKIVNGKQTGSMLPERKHACLI